MLTAPALLAQHRDTNPFSAQQHFAEGLRLYRTNCGVCHGMEGKSGRGARLAVRTHRHGNSDAELFRVIQNGISGTDMPGLWMDEDSIWKILLAVRSFEVNAGEACVSAPGDPVRGRALYNGQGGCATCHVVDRTGGRLGPDLTYLGLNYAREQLKTALLEPAKDIGLRYQTVRLHGPAGAFEGILLNEDAYSIHLMDRSERLVSFSKDELQRIEKPGGSLMPAYDWLSHTQINDMLSYLCSLRGAEVSQ